MKYVIYWRYQTSDEWEEIDTAENKTELDYLMREYRRAYNGGEFKTRRVPG